MFKTYYYTVFVFVIYIFKTLLIILPPILSPFNMLFFFKFLSDENFFILFHP